MNLSQEQQDLIRLHRWLSLKKVPSGDFTLLPPRWDLRVYAGDEPFTMAVYITVGKNTNLFNRLHRFKSKKNALNYARSIARWAEDEECPFETVWIEPHFEGEKWNPLTPRLIKPQPRRGNPAPVTTNKEQHA